MNERKTTILNEKFDKLLFFIVEIGFIIILLYYYNVNYDVIEPLILLTTCSSFLFSLFF